MVIFIFLTNLTQRHQALYIKLIMIFLWRKIVVKLLQENLLLENESALGNVDKNKFSFGVRI